MFSWTTARKLGVECHLKFTFYISTFPKNLGAVCDEIDQDILIMEHRYQGEGNPWMMCDYCLFKKKQETGKK